MPNVVSLHPRSRRPANQEVLAELGKMLELAQSGRIVSLSFLYEEATGGCEFGVVGQHAEDPQELFEHACTGFFSLCAHLHDRGQGPIKVP